MYLPEHQSCFDRPFDVVIVGEGYAAFAAATTLDDAGKSVLLIAPRGDLICQSGRSLLPVPGQCDNPAWTRWRDKVRSVTGGDGQTLDGAVAEVLATRDVIERQLATLYYAWPIGAELDGDRVAGLILATKTGVRRVVARAWIDATERGTLCALAGLDLTPAMPRQLLQAAYLQQASWPVERLELLDGAVSLLPTCWPTERAMLLRTPPDRPIPREAILDGLEALRDALGDGLAEAQLTHASVQPVAVYDGKAAPSTNTVPANLTVACPSLAPGPMETLADRFALGAQAARRLAQDPSPDPPAGAPDRPIEPIAPGRVVQADVVVAGAGTGGALAAIAAGRRALPDGKRVVCVDPLPAPGGIGTVGGIHGYYFGLHGGLQAEVDQRVADLADRFGQALDCRPRFHPVAKQIVLDQMLAEAGVDVRYGAMLYGARVERSRVVAVRVADDAGALELRAATFIDGTGDGDLCARAGAEVRHGRAGDLLPHAYSQSSGRLTETDAGQPRMRIVNFDAGWVDATDSQDLTRARLTGIDLYHADRLDNLSRPTYIAPAIGLRQSRQVHADVMLSLDDLLARRRFDDVVGYAGCHYDNHACDYHLESDEAAFWVWLARSHRVDVACELSYRMLLPASLSNVWIASRCLGVSQDAHHTVRMERDMQRIGEVAGVAACLALDRDGQSREVPYDALARELTSSGALPAPAPGDEPTFPIAVDPRELSDVDPDQALQDALAELDRGVGAASAWRLYRAQDRVGQDVRRRLDATDAMVSWLAAGIVAMWHDPQAEPRLARAIARREFGFDPSTAASLNVRPHEGTDPMTLRRLAPNWLVAVVMLRRCGTSACLDVLGDLAGEPRLSLDARAAVAGTVERLALRGSIGDVARAEGILDRLADVDPDELIGRWATPQRYVGGLAHWSIGEAEIDPATRRRLEGSDSPAAEDHLWQLELTLARARTALGIDPGPTARTYLHDPRRLVRSTFEAILPDR
jgi:hypothetical protein